MQKSKVSKKLIALIMSATMIISTMTGVVINNTETVKAEDYGISNPRINEDGNVTWDKVKFGNYKQSAKFEESEPIKWRILSVDANNNALLLADKGLDCKKYNEKDKAVTWETCTLRTWLNEDFYNEAFNESEQALIKMVTVKNDDNPRYGTEGGNDTKDKVYLLSIEEACKSAYGFDSAFNKESALRECEATDYARMNDAFRGYSGSEYDGKGYWWLRSPGEESASAAHVYEDGSGHYVGYVVNYVGCSVRPALQINLDSSLVTDAGEVASDGTVTELDDGYSNPKCTDEGTVWDCVYFGRYKQNNIAKKEPIEWRVLSVEGDQALLLADKGIDCMQYHAGIEKTYEDGESYIDYSCTWETSTVRKWLNSAFLNEAFIKAERSNIKKVTIKNDDNPVYGTEGGNDTTDKIYLLSIEEACNSAYGFNSTYSNTGATRQCQITDYARMNGSYRSKSDSEYAGNGYWWLRSPGNYTTLAAIVSYDGMGRSLGCRNLIDYIAIRPALRINLLSSVWENAGTVSTGEGESTQTPEPTQTSEPTNTPNPTDVPQETNTPCVTKTPEPTNAPQVTATPEPTKQPEATAEPTSLPTATARPKPTAEPTQTPVVTPAPALSSTSAPKLAATSAPQQTFMTDSVQKAEPAKIAISGVKCKRRTKLITGKMSVAGAKVKVKVGNKSYKNAVIKGKKFTLKVSKLKKKTKITIMVTKAGYKKLVKVYKVK